LPGRRPFSRPAFVPACDGAHMTPDWRLLRIVGTGYGSRRQNS
jgi:hypothetical protein